MGFQFDPAAGKNMDLFYACILYDHLPVDPEKEFRIQQLFQVLKGEIKRIMVIVAGA